MDDHLPGEVLGVLDRNKDSGITARTFAQSSIVRRRASMASSTGSLRCAKCRKQKVGRAVSTTRTTGRRSSRRIHLCRLPQKMTTIPVRSGGVVMPVFYGDKPVWLTGN